MMPGENQSGAGGMASEASSGTCHNCTVLSQSLEEYMTALLTLKQKIIDTDLLLSEYKEKCDELQKSQRESAKLHTELDEVLLKLGPLEKQTAEFEAVRAELEETTAALKVYQGKSAEVDVLREQSAKALAMNATLEESFKKAEDLAKSQSLENTKLRSEKKSLESDLQKTQESLRLSQLAAEDAENLKLENAKTLIVKSNLENQLLALEDTNLQQNRTIQDLESRNSNLEKSYIIIEQKLATLEKEFNKEKRCSSTQTDIEPKVDKAKVWTLLQQIWHCVDPLSTIPENLGLNDHQHFTPRSTRSPSSCPQPVSPFRHRTPQLTVLTPKGAKVSPSRSKSSLVGVSSPNKDQRKRKTDKIKNRSMDSEEGDESVANADDVSEESLSKYGPVDLLSEGGNCKKSPDTWEILSLFPALPAPLSPLPSDESMEVDTSLKENSVSEAEDGQQSQSTEPKPSEDSIAISSVSLSTENQLMTSLITLDSDEYLQKVLPESQEMQVEEEMKENSEDLSYADTEHVGLNQAAVIEAESQPSTQEECTNPIASTPCCNASPEVPEASCNDGVGQGLEPVQQVIIPEESPDKEVQEQSEVQTNGYLLDTEPERTIEEVQSILTPVVVQTTELKTAKDQDSVQDGESFCTVINGVTSGKSLVEDDLKRKDTEDYLRPDDLITSEKLLSNENPESVEQVQGTDYETKEKHNQPEDEKNNGQKDESMCKPVILEDGPQPDPSISNFDNQQEEHEGELSISFSPNIENVDGGLNEDSGTKPEDPGVKSQDSCPASSNIPKMSSLSKTVNLPLTVVASGNELTSTQFPESIGKVLTEMGPPLPPVLLPLTATPPKGRKHLTPNRPSIQLTAWSSTEDPFGLSQKSKVPSPDPGLQVDIKTSLPMTPLSPPNGVPSSPLQFGSETPKHALPVPGRLPSSALNSSPPSASQENSMQMLDTMYPELSAQARTLNILRGNVNLGRAANESGTSPPSVNPILGNKTINSSSTAFTKTDQKTKRVGANVLLPKSAKRLRLDTCSPDPSSVASPVQQGTDKPINGALASLNSCLTNDQEAKKTVDDTNDTHSLIIGALEKLQNECFDVLPVIRSHVFLKRISEVPVLRDEEKSIISDFCLNRFLADDFMLVILAKIKREKAVMKPELLQSHCRVFVGLCRWRGDCQKAWALAYSLLKEGFPEAPKLILFMLTTWPTFMSHDSPLCQAIKTASKLKAEGEILDCLSNYLHWDESPPDDIHQMVTTLLNALLQDTTLIFHKHERHGHDLCSAAWEYILSLELLCAHLGWKWTHDNIIGKELWPVMNTWVTQPRSQQTPVRDICVAAVLRLIGRLGQLGLKEKLCMSVQNVAKAINLFGKHGISEGVPWEVQLSAVYAIYDLAPSNPKDALDALAAWRGEITQPVPPAITSCITQIGSICRQIKP